MSGTEKTKDLLTGWKEISTYMGISIQTAKKYKRFYGLPVMYFPGGKPIIFTDLIKEWVLSRHDPSSSTHPR